MLNQFILKFNSDAWKVNPELHLFDNTIKQHPEIMEIFQRCDHPANRRIKRGRQDKPTIEQVVKGAFYMQSRSLDYDDLVREQYDSRICSEFIGLDQKCFSRSTWHHHISLLDNEKLKQLMVSINNIAINEGLETITKLRTDTTTVLADVKYPTNNSLVYDCIREADRQLRELHKRDLISGKIRNYKKQSKRLYAKINNAKSRKERKVLFGNYLIILRQSKNQVKDFIASEYISENQNWRSIALLYGKMVTQYYNTRSSEINDKPVSHSRKLFSIYQGSVDLIVKGSRKKEFGHKIRVATGNSPLLLTCDVLKGNPSDKKQLIPVLEQIKEYYNKIPRDVTADGCYATKENYTASANMGCANAVLHKTNRGMKDIVSSLNLRTRLKNFRAGIEAVISNLKRGFSLRKVKEKTFKGFERTVIISTIAYNIRVITRLLLAKM